MPKHQKTTQKSQSILWLKIFLGASLLLNIGVIAFGLYAVNSNRFVLPAGNFFFGKAFEADPTEAAGRSWSCAKSDLTPEYTTKGQRFCYGIIILDSANQEVK